MLAEQRPTLALGHASPDPELDTIVQRIGSALELNWAVTADGGRLSLGGAADEEIVGVCPPTPGLRHPCEASFRISTGQRGQSHCSTQPFKPIDTPRRSGRA
ncbi:hypothetical protein GCM10022231_00130 [Gordonia caeni]|uniref:Uncharacterized protein n=1 Tax=Gordonia caeni TaxID=1007097 RepID=A0ABP7NHD7_9ACTN